MVRRPGVDMMENMPKYQYKMLNEKLGKLSGVKKELKAMKDKIDNIEVEIKTLKKDNTVLRKLSEELKEKFIKRRRWEHISYESNKKKMEELKNEAENNTSSDEH